MTTPPQPILVGLFHQAEHKIFLQNISTAAPRGGLGCLAAEMLTRLLSDTVLASALGEDAGPINECNSQNQPVTTDSRGKNADFVCLLALFCFQDIFRCLSSVPWAAGEIIHCAD